MGATRRTARPEGTLFHADLADAGQVVPGTGVGAFWGKEWRGKWVVVSSDPKESNWRIYLVEEENTQCLMGVFYAPQAGKGVNKQLEFYRKLSKTWRTACRKFPKAWRVMAGDSNLRGLEDSGQGKGGRVKKAFRNFFLNDMKVANWINGKAEPTHEKGGMLDIIMVGEGIEVLSFGRGGRGMGASDHRMVWAELAIPGGNRPREEIKWRSSPEAEWDGLAEEIEEPLRAWHEWFKTGTNNCSMNTSKRWAEAFLTEATATFGAIVLGNMWRNGSPYGKFCRGEHAGGG